MTKTFGEVLEKFKQSVEEGKHNRFSRRTFEEMATELLNDAEYSAKEYRMSKDEEGNTSPSTKDYKPSEGLRKFVYKTLIDFGVDKQEAGTVLDGSYKFNQLQGIHEFVSELLYNYAQTHTFNFISGERFRGSLTIGEVEESTRSYQINPKFLPNGEGPTESKIHYAPHQVLRVKASAPEWVRTRL